VRGLPGQFRLLRLAVLLSAFAGVAYPQLTLTPSTPPGTAPGTYVLPTGFTTKVYSTTIFTNGNGPTTWSEKGALPPGLSFNPGPTNTATITGSPTTTGTFIFVVTAQDPQFGGASQQYSITVATLLAITTQLTLPNATLGANYIVTFTATGGTPPYNWFLAGGLTAGPSPTPPGLVLSRSGQLTGIPTQAGTFKFTVQVNDSDPTNPQSNGAVFSLTVNPAPTISGAGALPAGTVGVAYQTTLAVQGGSPPFTWTLQTSSPPPGLSLSTSGVIAGTPTQAGNFALTVVARDVWGASVAANYTLAVTQKLSITTSSFPDGAVGKTYPASQISATGGTAPYTFSTAGSFPTGLTLNASTGAITGIPVQGGHFAFTAQVKDSAGITATQSFVINIISIVFVTPSPLPEATVGAPYSQPITVVVQVPPGTFIVDSGALPDGITLNSAGVLMGTPTNAGTFQFVVRVTDNSLNTATQAYQLTVVLPTLPAPTITGVTTNEPPAQQPTAAVQLANPYPLDLTVTITLTFASAVGSVDDPAIQFSTGGRTVQITIPAGSTVSPNVTFSTGTVAGTITLTLSLQASGQNVTPEPAPTSVVQIAAAAPVITNITATRSSSGIEVDVTGFSNTRDMTSAAFTFQAAAGTNLQTSQVTVSTAGQLFTTWYADPTSTQFGSRFTFAQQFTISGNLMGITAVSATLTNKQGTSNAMSSSVQ
jgi:hypothetical protein